MAASPIARGVEIGAVARAAGRVRTGAVELPPGERTLIPMAM